MLNRFQMKVASMKRLLTFLVTGALIAVTGFAFVPKTARAASCPLIGTSPVNFTYGTQQSTLTIYTYDAYVPGSPSSDCFSAQAVLETTPGEIASQNFSLTVAYEAVTDVPPIYGYGNFVPNPTNYPRTEFSMATPNIAGFSDQEWIVNDQGSYITDTNGRCHGETGSGLQSCPGSNFQNIPYIEVGCAWTGLGNVVSCTLFHWKS
jgi:hypothetical protein